MVLKMKTVRECENLPVEKLARSVSTKSAIGSGESFGCILYLEVDYTDANIAVTDLSLPSRTHCARLA